MDQTQIQIKHLNDEIAKIKARFVRHAHETIDGTTPIKKTAFVTYTLPDTLSQTATNYGIIYIATRPCNVKAISEVHTVAGSSGSAVTLQLEKLTATTAPGSGTGLLTTEFNLKGTANTVQRGVLTNTPQTASGLLLGDRLALKVTGTLTALKGVAITVELEYV